MTWTVAEGGKGRRWREVLAHGTDVIHTLLLETDPNGRFSHLELARADGLWTFHPEPDGTIHGNHVGADSGVVHIAGRPFGPDDALIVEGSPISLAAIAWGHAAGALVRPVGGMVVALDGTFVEWADVPIERLSPTRWRIGEGSPIDIDEAGLPVLDDGEHWPLELE